MRIVDVSGYEGKYSIREDGQLWNIKRGRPVALEITYDGYQRAALWKDGVRKLQRVHRIVAVAFIPNPHEYATVNHLNGVKTDNRVENLEWCSAEDNIRHAYRSGLYKPRDNMVYSNKLSKEQVLLIRASKEKSPLVAKMFGISESTVRHIRQRRIWNNI